MLSPESVARLHAETTRWGRVRLLFEAVSPQERASVGPLADLGVGFKPAAVACGYLAWLAYIRARMPSGMLANRPPYDAIETFTARMRGAFSRARDFEAFRLELLGKNGLDVGPETLGATDLMWWRSVEQATTPAAWRWMKTHQQDAIEVAKLLVTERWLYEPKETKEAEDVG